MAFTIHKTVTSVDGTRIYADAVGNSSRYPIVFIHGFGSSARIWDRQFNDPKLYGSFYLVRYDLRGHGRSGYPMDATCYKPLCYAQDFKAICEAFGLNKPSVVAWSFGACTIVDVSETYGPEFIDGIAYSGGPVLTRELHKGYIHPYVVSFLPDLVGADGDATAKAIVKYIDTCVENPEKTLTYEERLQWAGTLATQPPAARALTLSRLEEEEPKKWAAAIKRKPVTVIQGTKDRFVETEKMLKVMESVLGAYELRLLEGVGHAPHFERAQEVNGYLVDFFIKLAKSRG